MQALITGLVVALAALFLIRHVRRAAGGKAGCGHGCSSGCPRGDGRRVGVPGLGCSGACAGCRAGRVGR